MRGLAANSFNHTICAPSPSHCSARRRNATDRAAALFSACMRRIRSAAHICCASRYLRRHVAASWLRRPILAPWSSLTFAATLLNVSEFDSVFDFEADTFEGHKLTERV